MKKIFIIAAVLLVLGTGTYAAFKGLGITLTRDEKPVRYEQLDMGEFVVNLRDDHRRYLRAQIVIEYVHTKETEQILDKQMAKAMDKIISVLRSKSVEDLALEENIEQLRLELITELETALGLEKSIVDLWFVLFMIQ